MSRPTAAGLIGLALLCPCSAGADPETRNLRVDFGAIGDGKSDDTAALQAWLAAAAPGVELVAPAGTYRFTESLAAPKGGLSRVAIAGAGPYQTVFLYAGAATNVDLISIGDGGEGLYQGWFLHGFRLTSTTRMTGGAALRLRLVTRSTVRDVVADGQDGEGNLFDGFWFDGIDIVTLTGFEATAQRDAVKVNAGPQEGRGQSDFLMFGGKISSSGVGLHVAGGFGGVACDTTDVIGNGINVLIDDGEVPRRNREVALGSNCWLDSAMTGDNLLIDDPLSAAGTVQVAGWVAASRHGAGIRIAHWREADVEITGVKIFSNAGDGLRVEDPTTRVLIATGTSIDRNGGWGVNATVPTDRIFTDAAPWNNKLGNFAPNARVESLGPTGFRKHADGSIDQWGEARFAANGRRDEVLVPAGGNPVPWSLGCPGGWLTGTLEANVTGFPNGPAQQSVAVAPAPTGVSLTLVSSVPVRNEVGVVWHGRCR